MIICVPSWHSSYGGPVVSNGCLIELLRHHHQILLITILPKNNSEFGYPIHKSITTCSIFKFLFSKDKYLVYKRDKIVLCNGLWSLSTFVFILLSRFSRFRLFIHPRGMLQSYRLRSMKKLLVFSIYKIFLSRTSTFLASSSDEYNDIRFHLKHSRIKVLPNYLYLQNVSISRSKYTDSSRKSLLFFSRISKKKNLDLLINAWRRSGLRKNWNLNVCGGIDSSSGITADLFEKALSDHVFYFGHINSQDKGRFYETSHAFILPTSHENFGNSILEALSYGLPVLTTNRTPWTCIQDHRCGLIFEPNTDDILYSLEMLSEISDEHLFDMAQSSLSLSSKFEISAHSDTILRTFS